MDSVEELLKLSFSAFAKRIGEISRNKRGREKETTYAELSAKLNAALAGGKESTNPIAYDFKVVLGLSLLVACETDDAEQRRRLYECFLDPLDRSWKEPALSEDMYHFVLSELTYLDQFLWEPAFREQLKTSLDKHFANFPKSPAYIDYTTGWTLSKRMQNWMRGGGTIERDDDLQVILVGSVKGGVGKTLVSVTLGYHIVETDPNAQVLLMDLDSSGPTLQYNLDIHSVSRGLSPFLQKRAPSSESRWTYPTFADLLPDPVSMQGKRTNAEPTLLPVRDRLADKRIRAVVLPDSPIVTGVTVSQPYASPLQNDLVIQALGDIFDLRKSADRSKGFKFNYVIIDLGPGLFGTNGTLFAWLTERYATSLLLVSSPRAFDLATTLYESVWLSAPKYLKWHRPILQLLNMWPLPAATLDTELHKRTNRTLDAALSTKNKRDAGSLGSTDQIMFWRLREYLYHGAVQAATREVSTGPGRMAPRYDIRTLQYDEVLRRQLHSLDLQPLDFAKVRKTLWYKEDFGINIDEWLKSRAPRWWQ